VRPPPGLCWRPRFGFEPQHFEPVRIGLISSSPEDKRARLNRSLRLRWRLQSERAPLIRPGHGQVDETLQAKAARQASLDCRLDDLRRKESERQGHPDRTHSPALPRSQRLQGQAGIGFVGIALSAWALASGARANLITNGGFGDPNGNFVANDPGGADLVSPGSTDITGWTISGGFPVAWIPSGGLYGGLDPSPGNPSAFFLDLTGVTDHPPFDSVSQTIATTAGAHYQLTFDLGSAIQWGIQDGVTASAGSTSGTFISTNPGTSNNFWDSSETLNFVASGPSTLITLAGSTGFSYIGVDNVSVVETSPGGVPEPSTWAMMLVGFAGLGYAGYRRARKPRAA
jgi:Protein of unknown function (DUF642)/PEP-CTERM motif